MIWWLDYVTLEIYWKSNWQNRTWPWKFISFTQVQRFNENKMDLFLGNEVHFSIEYKFYVTSSTSLRYNTACPHYYSEYIEYAKVTPSQLKQIWWLRKNHDYDSSKWFDFLLWFIANRSLADFSDWKRKSCLP